MPKYADFLIEILTEELPPKSLQRLAKNFLQEIQERLKKSELSFGDTQVFATPRRLAVIVKKLDGKQADTNVERKGPALEAAFDKNGNPTPACLGFARSCGVSPDQLITIKNNSGAWVGAHQKTAGKNTTELLPTIVQQSLAALPIAKRMRWGSHSVEFVRPVQSVMMLYDGKIINTEILGCRSGNKTRGHRFLSKGWITVKNPSTYASQLEKNFVIADFNRRKEIIAKQAEKIAKKNLKKNMRVVINDALLDEVTGLVEWPVAICGNFDKKFLSVPAEALISAMQDHQRYFPVVNEQNKLLPHFIAICNIESKNTKRMTAGNERVLRARLSDAAFFFEVDKKQTLESRLENLKNVVFQAKLGSLYDKSKRLSKLAGWIANKIGADSKAAERVGWLAKTDLTTALVGEFPELQGTAGFYYALNDKEPQPVAKALNEQYMPRFSGDALPSTPLGYAIAIADRLDSLVGVFGINQQPTAEKDPFGLRRAALGIIRILIEKKLDLDLRELLEFAKENYSIKFENSKLVDDILNFMLERLKPFYQEHHVSFDVFAAVSALNITKPYDIDCRIHAVQAFKKMSEAEALSIANKRVSNILTKYDNKIGARDIDETLFENDAERILATKLKEQQNVIANLSKSAQYQKVLAQLAQLRKPVDDFFDKVLVMTDDKPRRENRLLLLKKLRELFLNVADIALLQ